MPPSIGHYAATADHRPCYFWHTQTLNALVANSNTGADRPRTPGVQVATVSNPTLAPAGDGGAAARRIGLGVGLGLGLPLVLFAAVAVWWLKFRQPAASPGEGEAASTDAGAADYAPPPQADAAPPAPQEEPVQTQTEETHA